jgi:hypothetical protein
MKVKIALLLLATLGSVALVASAQQATYVIKPDHPQDQQETKTEFIVNTPRGPQVLRPVGADKKNAAATYTINGGLEHRSLFPFRGYQFSGEAEGLSGQAEQLAQQLAQAKSDSDRDKIKGQLSEVLEKQFDERQKRHEQELKALEAQVKELKNLVDKRQENRREIIGARLNQIVKEAQGLGW